MPGEDIQSWSTTATLNGNADTSINFSEGQSRASVNNSARSLMAAHAKDRNLKNGSIVTAGTANAQTFSSGLSYTTTPTNLTVRLKIGPGLTNTGPATLNMDGIGAAAIINNAGGAALLGGEMVADSYRDFCWNGTNWALLTTTTETAMAAGILRYGGPYLLTFTPYNGAKIKIAGVLFDIPTVGIAGLDISSGVYVDGVAGQPLLANTKYLVFVRSLAGVLTADFLTGGYHITSTTVGNVGTEVYSVNGSTADDSRTLIGMVKMNALQQFTVAPQQMFVLSWFNQAPKSSGAVYLAGDPTCGSGPWTEVSSTFRIEFLCWAGDAIVADVNAACAQALGGSISYLALGWDGAQHYYVFWNAPNNDYTVPVSLSGSASLAEGYHYQQMLAGITGTSGTLTIHGSGYTSQSLTIHG